MATAAGDALDIPVYGSNYRVSFGILDADGDLVTGATGLDSEVSIDCGTFTDCTNEATEIATSSGMYYLDLSGAEMTGKIITVIVKTSSSGAKTTTLSIHPTRMAIIATGTAQAGAGSTITLAASTSKQDNDLAGMYVRCNNNSPAGVQYATRRIISNVASTQVATVESAWGTNPSSATTYDLLSPCSVNVTSFAGTMPTSIATAGVQDVNAKAWGNTTITAASIPVATAAGASGGLLISGSNSGTTTLAALTVTGALTVSDGITVTRSSSNTSAVSLTGNGTGHGLSITSGSGATGNGINVSSSATNGTGMSLAGNGTGHGLLSTGGATGNGVKWVGGGTTGSAWKATTTQGIGMEISPTEGHGIAITANGTDQQGIVVTGGTAGTCDAMKLVAGTGGVGLRSSSVTVAGATTLAAVSGTTLTFSGAVAFQSTFAVTTSTNLAALSCSTFAASGTVTYNAFTVTNAMTVSGTTTHTGAVSFGSTFGVTGATTLAGLATGALSGSTITYSGAVALQSTLVITGATTFTGAITASNASNNIVGINIAAAAEQKISKIVHKTGGTVYYVSTGGASGNDGLTWATAKDLPHRLNSSTAGDVIVMGPGTFAETTNVVTPGASVALIGAGIDRTKITTTVDYSSAGNPGVVLSDGSHFEGFKVTCATNSQTTIVLGNKKLVNATGWRMVDVGWVGGDDCLFLWPADSGTMDGVIVRPRGYTSFDNIIGNVTTSNTIRLDIIDPLLAPDPDANVATYHGCYTQPGHTFNVYGGTIKASASTIMGCLAAQGGTINAYGVTFNTSGAGTKRDVDANPGGSDVGTINVWNCSGSNTNGVLRTNGTAVNVFGMDHVNSRDVHQRRRHVIGHGGRCQHRHHAAGQLHRYELVGAGQDRHGGHRGRGGERQQRAAWCQPREYRRISGQHVFGAAWRERGELRRQRRHVQHPASRP
jgi:fibronectin-binding autotransporter adhesin